MTVKNQVECLNESGKSDILLVCEHATKTLPVAYGSLGLQGEARHILTSHAGWDIGAYQLARVLSRRLDASLVSSGVSRLLYDCNRAPDAVDAIPEQCEFGSIPGNIGLSNEQYQERIDKFYIPFRDTLAAVIKDGNKQVLVTIHSFTPIYRGVRRDVEIGIVHHNDERLANEMLHSGLDGFDVRRNEPYGREVTHTLQKHGIENGILNVMMEVRNDLLAERNDISRIGELCREWLLKSISKCQSTS